MWTVPGYTEIRELAVDAGGRTALATHTATGAPVTIRYLADPERLDPARLARHRDEARRLASLDSPYLLGCYEYVEAEDGTATVREHVDGVPLATLHARKPLPPEAALTVLKASLLALAAARAGGLGPGRFAAALILIDRQGGVKVTIGAETTEDPGGDVAALFATLRRCLRDKLPRRLRALDPDGEASAAAEAGDATALLAQVEATGARFGADWETTGRRHLARAVEQRRR
jgi:serine/threonine-protein kinase